MDSQAAEKHGGRLFQRVIRWSVPLGAALVLAGLGMARERWFPLKALPKGATAPYTLRASHDAVYDLHETEVAEAAEARQSYLPIYNKDNKLLYDYRYQVLKEALAEPRDTWPWPLPPTPPPRAAVKPPVFVPGADAGPAAPDMSVPALGASKGKAPDAGVADAGAPDLIPTPDLRPPPEVRQRRKEELEGLVLGVFHLLEPYYKVGVVADNEYPREKEKVRLYSRGGYHVRGVSTLHRFSDLRPALERTASRLFFKSEVNLRNRIVAYVLKRLPPNLTYATENREFITDISHVTGVRVVLIRRGEVLARTDQQLDARAYYAIRAAVRASRNVSEQSNHLARLLLLISILLLFVVATREISTTQFRGVRSHLVILFGLVLVAASSQALLLYLPLHPAAVPQAALALAVAVVLGRGPGLLTGIMVPFALILVQVFDLSTLLVSASGGVTAALAVRRRRRLSVLPAAVLAGMVQALVFEACRAAEGRAPGHDELWAGAETFLGGIGAGVLALASLPFVERFLARSSRGKLKLLTDFDNPLVRELRERAPGTFSHTVNLLNMVEAAVEAVGGDRLLARAGTLFHDLGKMEHPEQFVENQGAGPNIHDELEPEQSARAIAAHVPLGLAIAKRHGLPPDVCAFIPEHHGTTGLAYFIHKAREAGQEPDPVIFHYPGPKPQSLETTILMIADSVEAASHTVEDPSEEALAALVERVVFKKLSEYQFEECGITQGQLEVVKGALVRTLRGALHRRVPYPE